MVGVIPRSLCELEVAHTGVTDLRVVDSMHERKALMADLSDGFVALPGGLGTLEEVFEVVTWLLPVNVNDSPGIRSSVPVRFAVTANTPFSRQRIFMASWLFR